jgi:carboxyl-terminal processing protease
MFYGSHLAGKYSFRNTSIPASTTNMAFMLPKLSDPETNFETLWNTFQNRYPFFTLRNVDWNKQYETYRPRVTKLTTADELFDIFCEMLEPLDDGHVELKGKTLPGRKKRYFNPEPTPRFRQEFSKQDIRRLFETTQKTLSSRGFGQLQKTAAWMLHYCRSSSVGYIRILELEGVKKRKLKKALDSISADFSSLKGLIVDIRDNPGGDDSTVIAIVNRFCDQKQIAFHRKTKIGPGDNDFTPTKSWHIKPQGPVQFTGPIVLLSCDSVFSGGEVFALAMKQLPNVTIIGDDTNGIFSYQLEKKLPNGWRLRLSYQVYFSADMVCYEGRGVPVDIKILNDRSDIDNGVDPLIDHALEVIETEEL